MNFSNEKPSVHLLRALVGRIRYLRNQEQGLRGRSPHQRPVRFERAQHYGTREKVDTTANVIPAQGNVGPCAYLGYSSFPFRQPHRPHVPPEHPLTSNATHWAPPPIWRRLASFIYEGVILFGLVVIGGLFYSPLVGQRHALHGSTGLQAILFGLIGLYFVWFWRKSGQTLPMKTWHILLQGSNGLNPGTLRGCLRYVLSWLWFLPALWGAQQGHLSSSSQIFSALLVGVLVYAGLAWVLPGRQFLHDVLAGTRLIDTRPGHANGQVKAPSP